MESKQEKERRHLAYIDVNRSVLADRALEAYQAGGRGAWMYRDDIAYCDLYDRIMGRLTGRMGSRVGYLSAKTTAKNWPQEPHAGWPDPLLEEMVNTYDPEQEFVIVIEEEVEEGTFDLSFYKYALNPEGSV